MHESPSPTTQPSRPNFLDLIIAVLGSEWLKAHEIYQRAETQADPAKSELWAALRRERIKARTLSRRLKRYEGKGIEQGSKIGNLVTWGVSRSQ